MNICGIYKCPNCLGSGAVCKTPFMSLIDGNSLELEVCDVCKGSGELEMRPVVRDGSHQGEPQKGCEP